MGILNEESLIQQAQRLGELCLRRGVRLVGAESCTGGLVAATLTAVPGSSAWFERAFVTYSNASKVELLGVATETLEAYGAVSEETAREMALGALKHSAAQWSYAVTGIAGPDGGSPEKPVGTVCFAFAWARGLRSGREQMNGDRAAVRLASVGHVLTSLCALMEESVA